MTKETDCCTTEPATAESSTTLMAGERIRSWVRSPQGMTVTGIGVVAIGLALNWSWLVAVGAAPLVLSLAPCAAMCALGLCMNMRGRAIPPVDKPGVGGTKGAPESRPTRAAGAPS